MIVIMKATATTENRSAVVERVENLGYRVHLSEGEETSIVGIIGNGPPIEEDQLRRMQGVDMVVRVTKPYKLASREFHPENTRFEVGDITIGGDDLTIVAGPSSVESRTLILEIAHAIKEAGGTMLRGGVSKSRTSPYSFQGLGTKGLEYLAEAKQVTGLPIITEVVEPSAVAISAEYVDILQIGSRSMQNYALLNEVGKIDHPTLLKRNASATIEEWLLSAEYILNRGNSRLILCERGIRTFETQTPYTFDINAIPLLKRLTHLPVFADPSQGSGNWNLVGAVARGAVAAGADGVMIEVHSRPDQALTDGAQSLKPEKFANLVRELRQIESMMQGL